MTLLKKIFKKKSLINQKGKHTNKNSEYFRDIRMIEVNFEEGEKLLSTFLGENVYIKCICDKYIGDDNDQLSLYTKFKINDLQIDNSTILIFGKEDYDRLILDKIDIISMQKTPNSDEILILSRCEMTITYIWIKKYLPQIGNRLNEIAQSERNIIITEGKTDWKHIKTALIKFQKKGKYTEINFDFFEYEDEVQMGADTLWKVCEYNKLFYNPSFKIFIFDADREDINKLHQGKSIMNHGNNVFSIIIPVPEFRRLTPLISIENYYTDEEIKTKDNKGYRLYLNNKFDHSNGFLQINNTIYDCNFGKHKKMGDNYIIDTDVLKIDKAEDLNIENIFEAKKNNKNIALTKNKFANYILNSEPPFDEISYENFSSLFNIILDIIPLHIKNSTFLQDDLINEKEISNGVYLKKFSNGLMALEININLPKFLSSTDRIDYIYEVLSVTQNNTFNININFANKGIIDLPLPINDDLIMFLESKVDNQYNRVELFIHEVERVRAIEILNIEEASALIARELNKLY